LHTRAKGKHCPKYFDEEIRAYRDALLAELKPERIGEPDGDFNFHSPNLGLPAGVKKCVPTMLRNVLS
jgi:hypothetical protein